jgi:hypothetical protein
MRIICFIGKLVVAIGLCIVLAAALVAFWPMKPPALEPDIQPVESFQDALRLIDDLQAQMPAHVRPECRGLVMHHGGPTKRVYVLMHGLTNCPAQFKAFGRMLFEGGANVVIPRLPYHGFSEGLDNKQVFVTAENMIAVAQAAVNLAHGLGDEVCVVGLSVNGTIAAWIAQNRSDLHTVMVISPFLAPPGLPAWGIAPLTRFIGRLPNKLVWWDPKLQDTLEGPEHSYRRFATHSLAWVMAIGLNTFRSSLTSPPQAARIIMVNSESDVAISLPRAEALAQNWQNTAPEKITNFVFPKDLDVPHDSIDPTQPGARTEIVYPVLLELLEESACAPRDSNPEPKD